VLVELNEFDISSEIGWSVSGQKYELLGFPSLLEPLVQMYVGAMYFVDSKSFDEFSVFYFNSYYLNVCLNLKL
jgi:hypothetical protein